MIQGVLLEEEVGHQNPGEVEEMEERLFEPEKSPL
jgi:hypothetical protein